MVEEKYRTFWPRFWAGTIDELLFYPLSLIDKFLFSSVASHLILGTWSVFHSTAFIIYNVSMLAWRGQTIGKKLCGIKVQDVSGEPITLKQAVLRDLPLIINAVVFLTFSLTHLDIFRQLHAENSDLEVLPHWLWIILSFSFLWFSLELITMLGNNKRRALHDFIAGTVVTRDA
jgi:uncharacterized RDD family membrane protein YckC